MSSQVDAHLWRQMRNFALRDRPTVVDWRAIVTPRPSVSLRLVKQQMISWTVVHWQTASRMLFPNCWFVGFGLGNWRLANISLAPVNKRSYYVFDINKKQIETPTYDAVRGESGFHVLVSCWKLEHRSTDLTISQFIMVYKPTSTAGCIHGAVHVDCAFMPTNKWAKSFYNNNYSNNTVRFTYQKSETRIRGTGSRWGRERVALSGYGFSWRTVVSFEKTFKRGQRRSRPNRKRKFVPYRWRGRTEGALTKDEIDRWFLQFIL